LSHKASKNRLRLAVTLGDPAGIGPEVLLKSLSPEILELAEITVVGSKRLLQEHHSYLTDSTLLEKRYVASPNQLQMLDIVMDSHIRIGQVSAASGAASFKYLQTAIAHTITGQFDGIVTGPIAKSAWAAAGHHYPGQTELLAEMSGTKEFGMMFVARSPHTKWQLRALLATTHIPLVTVSERLNPTLMSSKLSLLMRCLQQDFGIDRPKICIAGLNPHSGEGGQLGREEVDWMQNWLVSQRHQYPQAELVGLLPPDTMWVAPGQAWFGTNKTVKPADGYLALYHDQGLIPVKLMAFDRAVNTTIGLPFVRTSPDHGTAFDIAGKGCADATSMQEAILLAIELVEKRVKRDSNPRPAT
jgi:4-hydroxythreonine-4-phosphate dehydrogenase